MSTRYWLEVVRLGFYDNTVAFHKPARIVFIDRYNIMVPVKLHKQGHASFQVNSNALSFLRYHLVRPITRVLNELVLGLWKRFNLPILQYVAPDNMVIKIKIHFTTHWTICLIHWETINLKNREGLVAFPFILSVIQAVAG